MSESLYGAPTIAFVPSPFRATENPKLPLFGANNSVGIVVFVGIVGIVMGIVVGIVVALRVCFVAFLLSFAFLVAIVVVPNFRGTTVVVVVAFVAFVATVFVFVFVASLVEFDILVLVVGFVLL